MPPYTTSQAACVFDIWRYQSCRYLGLDEQSKTPYQRCFGHAKCLDKDRNDHPNIRIKSRSEFNSTSTEPATFTSKVEASNNPRTGPDVVSSTQKQSNLRIPIIILIILFVIFSLLLLFMFWRRRRRAQSFDNSTIKKGETAAGRSLSLESTLLNHNRISEESNAPGSVRSKSSSLSLEDLPISDIEKELIVEPSLKTHPAFKFIDVTNPYSHHPCTRVALPEIPSPLPSPVHQLEKKSKHMSYHSPDKAESAIARSEVSVRKNSLANLDSSLWSKDTPDRDGYSGYSCESLKTKVEPITPLSISEKGHQGRCEIVKEESDKAGAQDEFSKLGTDSETYPWHELFSKITRSKSPELKIKDISQLVKRSSSYHKLTAHITQDNSDQIHLISNRWSDSSDNLPNSLKNSASDWYIPGSWINSTKFDDDNTSKNEASSGYDTSDTTLKSKSQKFIYLNLRSESNSPNPSMLDCSEKIIAKSEFDNDENNKLETEPNDSEIEKSETKIWRRWLKR